MKTPGYRQWQHGTASAPIQCAGFRCHADIQQGEPIHVLPGELDPSVFVALCDRCYKTGTTQGREESGQDGLEDSNKKE